MVFELLRSREARSLWGSSWVWEAVPEKQCDHSGDTKEQFKIELPVVVLT